jgi:hypothetical protein
MPLDGFHVVRWASQQSAGMSSAQIGGLALVALLIGIIVLVSGLKQSPTSWALVVSGAAGCTLAYYIAGASAAGTINVDQQTRMDSAAWTNGPHLVALFVGGFAAYFLRVALRSWASEESSGKVFGALFSVLSLGACFVSVQLIRGGLDRTAVPDALRNPTEDSRPINLPEEDRPVRPALSAPRR